MENIKNQGLLTFETKWLHVTNKYYVSAKNVTLQHLTSIYVVDSCVTEVSGLCNSLSFDIKTNFTILSIFF